MDTVKKGGERIKNEKRCLISSRYKSITKAVNKEFRNIDSDTLYSLYVGSYGRGTAINSSDIDMLVVLPKEVYEQHDELKGNGQSRLLQAVRNAVMEKYPRSDIHADGQVVVIKFSDGMKFEILPAFEHYGLGGIWDGTYDYPDSNKGGKWRSTNPKAEQKAMKKLNEDSNGLLFDTCKHMREIRDIHFSSYHLPGIVIDSFVYHNLNGWHWLRDGEEKSDKPAGTYEKHLYNSCPYSNFLLSAPGSNATVDTSDCVDVLNKVLKYMSKDQ